MALLLFFVLLALVVSFLCSILEAVLLSVTPSYVALAVERGTATGRRLRRLKEDIDRPLAAILSLNTIAHTVGATGAGAQAAVVFGGASIGVISGVLTLLILVLSEIIPKTLGALYWRRLAPVMVHVLGPMIWLMWPLVRLSQALTGLFSRGRREVAVSPAELTAMADLGAREGVIDEGESRVLKNLFLLRVLRARDVMTPRTVVVMRPQDTTVREVVAAAEPLRFSRIPIYGRNQDDVTGMVLRDEILLRAAHDELDLTLGDLRRELMVVPETLPLSELFERMLGQMSHIALVADEYGGSAGIVTLEDVVETLLGLEIVDEADTTADMQALARRRWQQRAERLGLLPAAMAPEDREAVVRLGLTGGRPPRAPE